MAPNFISIALFATSDHFCLTHNLAADGVLRHNADRLDENCKQRPKDLKVIVHGPNEYPPMMLHKRYAHRLPEALSEVAAVRIEVDMVEATEDVRQLPLDVRRCYFPDERPLELFLEYTRDNCLLECYILDTSRRLGCRPPGLPGSSAYNVCSNFSEIPWERAAATATSEPCDCLGLCTGSTYTTGFLHSLDVVYKDVPKVKTEGYYLEWGFMFGDTAVQTKVRTVKVTITGFLAQCAGFLGLALGMSVLSVFEVVYQFFPAAGREAEDDCSSLKDELLHKVRRLQREVASLRAVTATLKRCKDASVADAKTGVGNMTNPFQYGAMRALTLSALDAARLVVPRGPESSEYF